MKKNILLYIANQLLIFLIPLILMPYLARTIGSQGIGVYSYSYSIVSYFMMFGMLGISLYGKREIAKEQKNMYKYSKIFYEIYSIQIVLTIIALVLYIIIFYLSIWNNVYLLIQSIMLLSVLFDISWFYFGLEKFKVIVIRNFLIKIIGFILVLILIKDEGDISKYIFIMGITTLIGQLSSFVGLRKRLIKIKISFANILQRLVPISKLFIPVVAVKLYSIVDKTMIGVFANIDQVAYYQSAEKIVRIPITIITSLGIVMLPRMTYLLKNNILDEFDKYIYKSLMITMFLSFGATFGLIAISDLLVPIYLGENFNSVSLLIIILSPIILFVSFGNVFRTQYILPKGMDTFYTKTVLIASLINILLNLFLIPVFGTVGAVIASITSEGFICIYQSIKIKSKFNFIKYLISLMKFFISGIILLLAVKVIPNLYFSEVINLLFKIIIGMSIYVLSVTILEIFTKDKTISSEIYKILGNILKFFKLNNKNRRNNG